jgi:hypothetical protein
MDMSSIRYAIYRRGNITIAAHPCYNCVVWLSGLKPIGPRNTRLDCIRKRSGKSLIAINIKDQWPGEMVVRLRVTK